MPCARRASSNAERAIADAGSASLEFLVGGVLLLVPVVYLVLALGALQGAAFATEGAARHAARVLATSASPDLAAAERVTRVALADFGLDADEASTRVRCSDERCGRRGAIVSVTVEVDVPLPLIPAALLPARIPVSAQATQRISVFAGDAP